MTQPAEDAQLTPLDLLARQNEAIEKLTRTVELMQQELQEHRRRLAVLEGVPWPDQEPPEPD